MPTSLPPCPTKFLINPTFIYKLLVLYFPSVFNYHGCYTFSLLHDQDFEGKAKFSIEGKPLSIISPYHGCAPHIPKSMNSSNLIAHLHLPQCLSNCCHIFIFFNFEIYFPNFPFFFFFLY